MSVSVPNFEQEDQQVMDVVNPHSTPEAASNAEQISEQWNAPKEPDNTERMISREAAKIRASNATEERKRQERLSVIGIILCVIVAAALLVVLAKPQMLVWLVNVGVATCCTIAGIIIDRRIRGGEYAI